jgi:hypothetical protein
MFVSRIWQTVTPGGEEYDAVPSLVPRSTLINTLAVPVLCSIVTRLPLTDTVPIPLETTPPQQNRYSPVATLINTTIPGLLSSCTHRSNAVTAKLHEPVLPEASVAVHVTVVVPIGKQLPDAGEQAKVAPGQLSATTGAG